MPDLAINKSGGWAFILNPYVIDADLPFELAPDCYLRKASGEETQQIKVTLSKAVGDFGVSHYQDIYEAEAKSVATENGAAWSFEKLPESEWRYYVVTTPDRGHMLGDLQYASNVASATLEISALTFFKNGGRGSRPGILQNHFFYYEPRPARRIGKAELGNIAELYRTYTAIDSRKHPEISRALGMLDSLSFLAPNSPFQVLGLFAIIEMLITHNPKLEDRGDSITHQMQSKIPLLARRFAEPLDYVQFFGNASQKKIWSALYGYRSSVAHGGTPDFQSGTLQTLRNQRNADSFLREVVKALLRQAMKEPELFMDLREC